MTTYVMRVWLSDRPGALGAVASRVGAVGADVVGIEILERGAGRAVDEVVIDLPDDDHLELLISEVQQVDGCDVEDVRRLDQAHHDPRLDALETAARLVGVATPDEAVDALCEHAVRTVGSAWGAVVSLDEGCVVAGQGEPPTGDWLVAFLAGSQTSARLSDGHDSSADDIVWAPLPSARMALVMGRLGQPYRARERHQVAALARIVDTRFRELTTVRTRLAHPARAGGDTPT